MPLQGSNSAILDPGLVLIQQHAWKMENGNQTQASSCALVKIEAILYKIVVCQYSKYN